MVTKSPNLTFLNPTWGWNSVNSSPTRGGNLRDRVDVHGQLQGVGLGMASTSRRTCEAPRCRR